MDINSILTNLICVKFECTNVYNIVLNKNSKYYYIISERYPSNKIKQNEEIDRVLHSTNLECCVIPSMYDFTIIYLNNEQNISKICIGYCNDVDKYIYQHNIYSNYLELWKNIDKVTRDFFIDKLKTKNKKLYNDLTTIQIISVE